MPPCWWAREGCQHLTVACHSRVLNHLAAALLSCLPTLQLLLPAMAMSRESCCHPDQGRNTNLAKNMLSYPKLIGFLWLVTRPIRAARAEERISNQAKEPMPSPCIHSAKYLLLQTRPLSVMGSWKGINKLGQSLYPALQRDFQQHRGRSPSSQHLCKAGDHSVVSGQCGTMTHRLSWAMCTPNLSQPVSHIKLLWKFEKVCFTLDSSFLDSSLHLGLKVKALKCYNNSCACKPPIPADN